MEVMCCDSLDVLWGLENHHLADFVWDKFAWWKLGDVGFGFYTCRGTTVDGMG
jgi:hypothetical protein